MHISPDNILIWQWQAFQLNATLLFTWLNMLLLTAGAAAVTRRLGRGKPMGRGQNLLEVLVSGLIGELEALGLKPAAEFLPFIGTLFLFVLISNLLSVVPGYQPPTGSLSTTTALAACVLVAVPWWGIRRQGMLNYLKLYLQPTPLMLPFNLFGEISRTLALAVRLFGNIMSGSMIAAILLTVAPLFFPVVMNLLGLLIGVIQAYIFAILAAVYIAAAVQVQEGEEGKRA